MPGFDPYLVWLDIPPHERPVNHYRLLGLRPQESDAGLISAAADRVTAHVTQFQNTEQAGACHRLLAEIHTARNVLLDPLRKSAYDSGMNRSGAEQPIAQAPQIPTSRFGPSSAAAERQIPNSPPVPAAQQPSATQPSWAPQDVSPAQVPVPPAGGVQPLPSPQGLPKSVQSQPHVPAVAPVNQEAPLPPTASTLPASQPAATSQVQPAPTPSAHYQVTAHPSPEAPPSWAVAERTGQVSTVTASPEKISTERTSRGRVLRRQQQSQYAYLLVAFAIAMIVFFFGAVLLLAIYLSTG